MELINFGTGSKGNCYLLKVGSRNILLDAGVEISKVNKTINFNDIDLVYISHKHKDHCMYYEEYLKRYIPTYIGPDEEQLQNISKYDDIKLITIPIKHGIEKNSAAIIHSKQTNELILYATDFNLCEYNLKKFAFTTLIVECNYVENLLKNKIECCKSESNTFAEKKYIRQFNTHMGLNGLIIFINSLNISKLKEIILIHKSNESGLVNEALMQSTLFSKYNINVGLCKNAGGIVWLKN